MADDTFLSIGLYKVESGFCHNYFSFKSVLQIVTNNLLYVVLSFGTPFTWGGMEVQECGPHIGTQEEGEDCDADTSPQEPQGWCTFCS